MKKCDYGCGQEAKYQFKNGKWCCSRSHASCPILRRKNSILNKGRKFSEKHKKGISIALKGKKKSDRHRKNLSIAHKGLPGLYGEKNGMYRKHHTKGAIRKIKEGNRGKRISEKHKKAISIANTGRVFSEVHRERLRASKKGKNNPMYDRKHTEKTKKSMRENHKDFSEEMLEEMRLRGKRLWQEPAFQRKMQEALHLKPNKPETVLINLLNRIYPNEWKYVGDYQFWLGGKNPDFMNINGEKKLIEMFGDYWHAGQDPQDRINHFKQYGFDTLVIWEHELENMIRTEFKIHRFMRRI